MYSRDRDGIRSDGQLYNYERGFYDDDQTPPPPPPPPPEPPEKPRRDSLFGGKLESLRNMKIDDLLLMAIGALLLLDSDEDNDLIALMIIFMLLF